MLRHLLALLLVSVAPEMWRCATVVLTAFGVLLVLTCTAAPTEKGHGLILARVPTPKFVT